MTPSMIVLTGLPGSGKSAIAESLGPALGIPVFAKDWLEAPLLRSGVVARDRLGSIGYELLTTLARRQLSSGQSAILDSVASSTRIRSTWRDLAREFGASWVVIECICSDEAVHRERLLVRRRAIPDWPELDWAEVERVRDHFAPWSEDRLILDALESMSNNIERALDYVRHSR